MVLDHELTEIVDNLRALGADGADVEAKRADRQLPPSIRATLSAFANTRGGVLILGLDESAGFAASGVREPARWQATWRHGAQPRWSRRCAPSSGCTSSRV